MTSSRRGRRRSTALVAGLAVLASVALAAASCETENGDGPTPGPGPDAGRTKLELGVWGSRAEVRAYEDMVEAYNDDAEGVTVKVRAWPSASEMVRDLEDPETAPDLYLLPRRDLAAVEEQELNVPLLELLTERGVDYGDGYSRDALLAFSADNELQCMPYGSSPMVMYYNTDLIDFATMRERDLPAPPTDDNTGWNLEMFRAAADFASRPKRQTRGVHIDPTLRGLAPFVYSGGGEIFDDDSEPTSLALSDDDTREALTRTLEVLRDPRLTLSEEQLSEASALEWFKSGRLGMIAGFRDLTPQLRAVDDLSFDVMPMQVLDSQATIGDVSGLCISSASTQIPEAADFLVHAVSDEAVSRVAEAGYLVPTNLQVSISDAFLQPDEMPDHAGVFNATLRHMVLGPLLDDGADLTAAVDPLIEQLFTSTLPDIEALTEQIDEESRTVLDVDEESESPSESSTG